MSGTSCAAAFSDTAIPNREEGTAISTTSSGALSAASFRHTGYGLQISGISTRPAGCQPLDGSQLGIFPQPNDILIIGYYKSDKQEILSVTIVTDDGVRSPAR